MMGKCKDCKWWTHPRGYKFPEGRCTNQERLDHMYDEFHPLARPTLVYTGTIAAYDGCGYFEPKESDDD